jgi:hypothetical protein
MRSYCYFHSSWPRCLRPGPSSMTGVICNSADPLTLPQAPPPGPYLSLNDMSSAQHRLRLCAAGSYRVVQSHDRTPCGSERAGGAGEGGRSDRCGSSRTTPPGASVADLAWGALGNREAKERTVAQIGEGTDTFNCAECSLLLQTCRVSIPNVRHEPLFHRRLRTFS